MIKVSLTFFGLLGEDVAMISVFPLNFSRSGKREALFGTGVGFQFGHRNYFKLVKIIFSLLE